MADNAESNNRLDRIERILEANAKQLSNVATAQESMIKAQDACFAALQDMIAAQSAMLRTLDGVAKLWGRSPN